MDGHSFPQVYLDAFDRDKMRNPPIDVDNKTVMACPGRIGNVGDDDLMSVDFVAVVAMVLILVHRGIAIIARPGRVELHRSGESADHFIPRGARAGEECLARLLLEAGGIL